MLLTDNICKIGSIRMSTGQGREARPRANTTPARLIPGLFSAVVDSRGGELAEDPPNGRQTPKIATQAMFLLPTKGQIP